MKRYFAILFLLVGVTIGAHAQADLAVGEAFSRFGKEKGNKLVVMHNTTFKGHKLAVYQALTYRSGAQEIALLLQKDRRQAKKIREVMDGGTVVSGYYMLAPTAKGLNRYILFNTEDPRRGAIVYMEGALGPDDIMRICYAKRTY